MPLPLWLVAGAAVKLAATVAVAHHVKSKSKGDTQSLELDPEIFSGIRSGEITNTIRKGRRNIEPGPLLFTAPNGEDSEEVAVTDVEVIQFQDLREEHVLQNGSENISALFGEMRRFYPELKPHSLVTVVSWNPGNE